MVPANRPTTLLLTALVVLAALPLSTMGVAGRAPPQPACGVCTDALTAAAAERGVSLERGETAATIRVTEDASTRVTARVELVEGADALRNETRRGAVVADAIERSRAVDDPVDLTSRLEGDTLVVTYRDPSAATQRAGVLLLTRFHASDPVMPFVGGGDGTVYPGADVLTVTGPSSHVVWGSYSNATTDGNAVQWTGADQSIERSTLVSFVPERAWFPGVRTALARSQWLLLE